MDHESKMIDLGDAKIETKGPPGGDLIDFTVFNRSADLGLNDE